MLQDSSKAHTISILVANKPGVLTRVSQVFSRRGFNIDALVVSPAMDGRFSRMTITAHGNKADLDQIIRQLNKLIDTMHCTDHTGDATVSKELALIKVRCTKDDRTEILQIVDHFACKTVDFTENSLIIQATGDSDKLDALINLLHNFEIVEHIRTGKIVMLRGDKNT